MSRSLVMRKAKQINEKKICKLSFVLLNYSSPFLSLSTSFASPEYLLFFISVSTNQRDCLTSFLARIGFLHHRSGINSEIDSTFILFAAGKLISFPGATFISLTNTCLLYTFQFRILFFTLHDRSICSQFRVFI